MTVSEDNLNVGLNLVIGFELCNKVYDILKEEVTAYKGIYLAKKDLKLL